VVKKKGGHQAEPFQDSKSYVGKGRGSMTVEELWGGKQKERNNVTKTGITSENAVGGQND